MSKTIQIELPLELIQAANLDTAHLSEEAARLLALALFREDQVSLGRAAELCQTPLAAFMEFAAKHGVPPIRYDATDVEEDHGTREQLGA
jgi:predicted HTH domain antitoxin